MKILVNQWTKIFKFMALTALTLIANLAHAKATETDISSQLDLSVFDQQVIAEARRDIHGGL